MAAVKFNSTNPQFFSTLRNRVDEYFKTNNLKHTGNFKLYAKTAILLSGLIASYIILVFFTPSNAWVSLGICALMGCFMAGVGFNVLHDGGHGSYSNNATINDLMSYTLNLMGGSSFMWKQKHNLNHHSFTNIEGMDDDIDVKPFLRVNTNQKRMWFHRFQHIYGMLLYGFTYFFWVFYNDFHKYFSGRVSNNSTLKKMKVSEHIMFWVTKISYVVTFIGLPMYNVGIVETILGYGVLVFVCGLVIAIVFQLAHIYEDAHFEDEQHPVYEIKEEWAIHQVKTTANFATKSKIVSWFLGGLNFQVEHHLFPRISHVHYPALNPILIQTCNEFGIEYKEFPTLWSAIRSHLIHLKRIGKE